MAAAKTQNNPNIRPRPTSPHLDIYKWQISAVMSIIHRMSGIALFFGFSILSWWGIICVFSKFDDGIVNLLNCWLAKLAFLGLSFAFFYHLCNGIRHLFWDIGKGYEIHSMHKSGWSVLIATAFFMLWFWCLNC